MAGGNAAAGKARAGKRAVAAGKLAVAGKRAVAAGKVAVAGKRAVTGKRAVAAGKSAAGCQAQLWTRTDQPAVKRESGRHRPGSGSNGVWQAPVDGLRTDRCALHAFDPSILVHVLALRARASQRE